MKAGSLQPDDDLGPLCESLERRHPQEKCASKCVRGLFLSAFIYFLSQLMTKFELCSLYFALCYFVVQQSTKYKAQMCMRG